ncbi:Tyrosine-protein kinase Drl [Armadillidium nasatum]|uniref:Tyrosine-protein kinase Drl n=1 Tax=Armadillidium nasatum TaxID=96803 RepID=A0A5N5SZI9_9CRUS|nr:Tyrosine-protein kinase Drl [Armadillidium nasatum]
MKLAGLNAELYYIREGVVNDYAMRFSVKIPPEIHSIYFRWESLTKKPVLYNMAVWVNETSITDGLNPITEPTLNISLSGTIPKKTETFELNLPCTGLINGEVEVILNLNVTSSRANQPPTVLYFNRRKICLKGIAAEKLLPPKSLQEREKMQISLEEKKEQGGLPLFVYILFGIASLGLVIAIITAVACWKAFQKTRKYPFSAIHQPVFIASTTNERKSTATLHKSSTSQIDNVYTSPSGLYTGPSALYTGPSGTYTMPTAMTGNSYASVYKFPFQSADLTGSAPVCKCTDSSCSGIYESSCYSNSKSESYFSSRDSREEEKYPLKCKFDKCCEKPEGNWVDVSKLRETFRKLQMDRERVRLTEILQEGRVGRVYKGWLQREHPELDQQVLIKTLREGSSSSEVESLCREGTLLSGLRHQNLLSLVGMSFVSNSPPFLIFPDPQGRNFKQYWSLGVFLWEASTLAERPYSGISTYSISSFLEEGHRLSQSPTCPDEIYRVMSACWNAKFKLRPSAQQVADFLSAFKENLTAFV